jgi:taurine dioxygenase
MHAAYLGLDAELRRRIAGLRWEVATRVPLPLVRAHPESGVPLLSLPFRFPGEDADDAELLARMLHLNSDSQPRIAGLGQADSEALMLRLLHHVLGNPAWIYEHAWKPGDLVLWDQRTTYHMATASPHRRVLSRTAVLTRQAPAYNAAPCR